MTKRKYQPPTITELTAAEGRAAFTEAGVQIPGDVNYTGEFTQLGQSIRGNLQSDLNDVVRVQVGNILHALLGCIENNEALGWLDDFGGEHVRNRAQTLRNTLHRMGGES